MTVVEMYRVESTYLLKFCYKNLQAAAHRKCKLSTTSDHEPPTNQSQLPIDFVQSQLGSPLLSTCSQYCEMQYTKESCRTQKLTLNSSLKPLHLAL